MGHCPLAEAIAYALTAEFGLWLSRLVEEYLPRLARTAYNLAVRSFVRDYAVVALHLLYRFAGEIGDGVEALFDSDRMGPLPDLVSQMAHEDNSLKDIMVSGMLRPVPTEVSLMERVLWASVGDKFWREIFIPVKPQAVSGPNFWAAATMSGVSDALRTVREDSFTDFVLRQEQALLMAFRLVLEEMKLIQQAGLIDAHWVETSTLIALARYGRLFGDFGDGRMDCVGDDVDIAAHMPEAGVVVDDEVVAQNAIPVLLAQRLSEALAQHGALCYLNFPEKKLRIVSDVSVFDTVLCNLPIGGFEVPVSVRFVHAPAPALGQCAAYDSYVPCPLNLEEQFAKYRDCTALPNLRYATLTTGNECVRWMEDGLSREDFAVLYKSMEWLEERSAVSMAQIWMLPACQALPTNDRGLVSVGTLPLLYGADHVKDEEKLLRDTARFFKMNEDARKKSPKGSA